MTLFVVVNMENGTRLAVAAFSTAARAERFIADKQLKDARVDFFEVGADAPVNPKVIYVSQRQVREGIHELAGYFFSRYDAERATGGQGFERRLTIDPAEDAVIETGQGESLPTPSVTPEESRRPLSTAGTAPAPAKGRPGVGALDAFPVGQVVLLAGLIGAIVLVIMLFHRGPKVDFGQNVVKVDWLPPAATAISFYREGRFLAAEFKISEEGFRALAASHNLTLSLPPQQGVLVPRYRLLAEASNQEVAAPKGDEPPGNFISVSQGYHMTRSESGKVITLAWDRGTGVAYLYQQ